MKKYHLIKIQQKLLLIHVMTMKIIYSIHKKKWTSHQLILSMRKITYIWKMMSILFIIIIQNFYHQRTMKMHLLDKNIIQKNEEFVVIKTIIFDILLNKSKSFHCMCHYYFLLSRKINGHHIWLRLVNTLISQIKNHSFDQMSKIIVNLGINDFFFKLHMPTQPCT